jgi:hypothetical protein
MPNQAIHFIGELSAEHTSLLTARQDVVALIDREGKKAADLKKRDRVFGCTIRSDVSSTVEVVRVVLCACGEGG